MADSDTPDTPSTPPSSTSEPPADFSSSEPDPVSSSSEPDPVSSSEPDPVSSSSFKSFVPSPLSSPSSVSSPWIPSTDYKAFFETIPSDIRSNHCATLQTLFHDYDAKSITTPAFELAVITLIKDVPAALESFKNLLPTGKFVRSPSSKKGRTIFTTQPCLNEKIRAELYQDPENYMLWLKHLIDYENGAETLSDFRRNVEVHLANMPNLRAEFDAKYPPSDSGEGPRSSGGEGDSAELIQDSTSGAGSGSGSKRRKTQ